MKDMATMGQNALGSLKTKGEELITAQKEKDDKTKNAVSDALTNQKGVEAVLSLRDALHIMYCLMAVDGTVSTEEEEKFDEIGRMFDPEFATYKDSLIEECHTAAKLETPVGNAYEPQTPEDEEDYYNQIHDYVGDLIKEEAFYTTDGIRGKTLLWDLIAIAYSEGDYSANEKRLIRYFARKAGVDNTVMLEMEHTIRSLIAIENEEEWLKSTDRPYKVIEERINELADRKNTIMQGVNALIAD